VRSRSFRLLREAGAMAHIGSAAVKKGPTVLVGQSS
jgi:hypothetical protein